LRISLFGFREVRTTAGIVAGVIEVAAFAALGAVALRPTAPRQYSGVATHDALTDRPEAAMPTGRWAASAFTALVAVLLGISLAATGPAPTTSTSSKVLLHPKKVRGVSVLANSSGYTLYWFAPDSATKSTCYGTCAVYWPPVIGSPLAGPGVSGKLGTIKRTGAATQVTYDGHPLYTYVGDSAPGQATGNDIDLNGGFWYEMTVSGAR
jgi:predicted lipoprotein with Yx(FWY)xxD motif